MTAKTTRKTGGRSRRTKGAGGIIHRADGRWEFRREIGRDPATGKRRFIAASGRTKADARERFGAKVAEMERTGLLPGAKSPYLKDYAERWLEEYRLNVKPTTYRTRAGRIHACMEVIGCIRLTDLTPDHIRKCMRVLSKRLAPSTLKDHFVSLKMMLDQAELEELIPVDPCRRVKPPRVEPTETRILSPDQPKQLIEAVPNRGAKRRGPALTVDVDESWMLLFELAFAAGMREGERYALIGRISGSAGKSSEPLKKALDHYWSPGGEFEWDVQPVVTVDSIERFERELKELSSFTAGFTTRRYLDSTAQEGGKTGEFYREMADAIGTDLDVEIKVSIPKDGFFPSAGRKLKGTVSDLVAFAVKQNKQMQVSGTDLAGKLLELNLVSHPVVEQEDIIIGENEPRQFTNLIDHLVKVCTEKQTYLYEISRGA